MSTDETPKKPHHRVMSSLEDLTMLEMDFPTTTPGEAILKEIDPLEDSVLPRATLVMITETDKLHFTEADGAAAGVSGHEHKRSISSVGSLVASLSEFDFEPVKLQVQDWEGTKFYSEYIKEGMEYLKKDTSSVIMLFESPSSSSSDTSFHNRSKFKFHDWPPPKSNKAKGILGPCRYSLMNGDSFPSFLAGGAAPSGLMEHWMETVPGIRPPKFVTTVHPDDTVYAYLPVEQIKKHVNDPDVHFHLAGKDSIHLMTQKTTKLLPDTRTTRPCVVKTTHSMGSKGIFIIRNDEDEAEFEQFLQESGNPTFVVTDFVDIARNVACHFYMHPDGETITWFGSNENKRKYKDGPFSSDSFLIMADHERLKKMQLPFVEEVVNYCKSLGFWGFCGVDVLFDSMGRGHLVDINPRVTGSCPALMTLKTFQRKYGFQVGLFRRSGDINYYGTSEQLWKEVSDYNTENEGKSRIVIHSMFEYTEKGKCRINIGVYGNDMDDCTEVLNRFAKPTDPEKEPKE